MSWRTRFTTHGRRWGKTKEHLSELQRAQLAGLVPIKAGGSNLGYDLGSEQGSQENWGVGQGSCQNCSPGDIAARGGVLDAVAEKGVWHCSMCRKALSYPKGALRFNGKAIDAMRAVGDLRFPERDTDRDKKQEIALESRALDAVNEERYRVEGDDGGITVHNTWVEVGGQFSRVDFAIKVTELSEFWADKLQRELKNAGGRVERTDGYLLGWWGLSANAPGPETPGQPGEGVGG